MQGLYKNGGIKPQFRLGSLLFRVADNQLLWLTLKSSWTGIAYEVTQYLIEV